jgi:ubiquinone/menaquinone biosynthesis C-methylase UbiE
MSSKSVAIRREILEDYYNNYYERYLFQKDVQGAGISYFESGIDKVLRSKKISKLRNKDLSKCRVLEIGGGNGEHLKYVSFKPLKYVSVDLRKPNKELCSKNLLASAHVAEADFVQANAEKLPFQDRDFDLVIGTCVLHHVEDVLAVLLESKRVVSEEGEVIFILPTDPGILNYLIKKFISYPKLRKQGLVNPEVVYAIDHRNHVGSIISQFKYVFSDSKVSLHFKPFRVKSTNFNLYLAIHARVSSARPETS